MGKVAIVTDSNSGITQEESKKLGIHILPMPFYINGELFYEDITLSQEEFYKKLAEDAEISTSQPSPGDVMDLWEELLKKYDEKVSEDENIHIDRYIGQKYNIEIRSIGNKIQSILYVYKY